MQIKVGTDIIEVSRIQESIENLGQSFLNKIYTEEEIKYCQGKKKAMYQHFAARFAAKEAAFKAVSTLLDDKYSISWKNAQTVDDENGKPHLEFVSLSKDVEKMLKRISSIDVSISHLKEYAIATVTILVD
ncbi:MAG: holo-ACP synthase [Christensenellales bacterium]|jgi:holo-[acyl-carrier-protein] synthase